VSVRRALGYRDAVILLGGDPPVLAALDRALAGTLSVATGGVSGAVLDVFGAQGRIIRLGRDLLLGLRDRLRGTGRAERMQRLEAAHAVIVVTAYFECLATAPLPFSTSDMSMSRQRQVALASGGTSAGEFLEALVAAPPRPTPLVPYERFPESLEAWYRQLSLRLTAFARGLEVWNGLDDAGRAEAERVLDDVLCKAAVGRYQELYAQLALEVPEFQFWTGQIEHQATRADIRKALAGIETLLACLPSRGPAAESVTALSNAYRAVLARPILAEGETPTGVRLPTLEEGYLDPDFRIAPVAGGELPSDESWWDDCPVRSDLTEYLAGVLTSPEATEAPLVVLGQPGAGKSVLMKVLAARLPAADFLPVRVALREVPADAEIQDQVEYAVRAATGQRSEWPALARAANGAIPVVLLDGFDELLQATGVSQSDYLLKVARFQQREADQGRPVVAVVTSRIAVADRVRYPEGTTALRLEPFREQQTRRWISIWNRHNEEHLRSRGLQPLPASIVATHQVLAREPLLLLMLALYDADANALQGGADGQVLDETRLYEELLTSFAAREIAKSHAAAAAGEMAGHVEQELQRLALIAFGMINRHRQWVTEAELDGDIAALQGRRAGTAAGFRAPLTPAEIAVGRFFFVQRAQAVRDGSRLQTYEFLHATFGEFLAARLTVQLAADLLARRPVLTVGRAPAEDDLLYALLSYAPLSSRQMLRHVRGICARQLAGPEQRQLAELLVGVLADSQARTEHRYAGYEPAPLPTAARHGIYSANLVLLILALTPGMPASRLFPESADPPGTWHRRALLWRSSLTEPDWTDLALALTIRHTWTGSRRDLDISLAADPMAPPEPIDPYWHFRYPPGERGRKGMVWHRPYWDQLSHKMDISSGTNDSSVRHAGEPLFRWLGPSIMTFLGTGDGPAASVAHALTELWLSRTLRPGDDPGDAYQQVAILFGRPHMWAPQLQRQAVVLILSTLRSDAARIPAADTISYLDAALSLAADDDQIRQLILQCALAAISATQDRDYREQLEQIAMKCGHRF